MDARGRLFNFRVSDGRCERLCDVLQFCSSTSLQSRFAACFNKNNLSGTVELVAHYSISTAISYSCTKGFNRHSERLKNPRFSVRLCNSTSLRSIIPFLYSSFNTRATANSCSLWGGR